MPPPRRYNDSAESFAAGASTRIFVTHGPVLAINRRGGELVSAWRESQPRRATYPCIGRTPTAKAAECRGPFAPRTYPSTRLRSATTVMLFLVVISILNLALGYALACYLGSASAARTSLPAQSADTAVTFLSPALPEGASPFIWNVEDAGPATGPTSAAPTASPILPDGHATLDRAADEQTVQARSSAVEKDLLAGIEEFRNQLAQLKTKGVAFAEPVA